MDYKIKIESGRSSEHSSEHITTNTIVFKRQFVEDVTNCTSYQLTTNLKSLECHQKNNHITYEVFLLIFILKTLQDQEEIPTLGKGIEILASRGEINMNRIFESDILKIDAIADNYQTYYAEGQCNLSLEQRRLTGWYQSSQPDHKSYFINLKLIKKNIHDAIFRSSETKSQSG